jgi:hypothetical protein
MLKTKEDILQMETTEPKVYITQSLLNSWSYLFEVDQEYYDQSYTDFLNSLQKIYTPSNFFMQRGLDFEKECMEGNVEGISEIIRGGIFQAVATKDIIIEGLKVLVYGKLDVLKAGKIYDIKRVSKYAAPKYLNAYQHHFYLAMVPEAKEFTYIINDGNHTYYETYRRDEAKPIEPMIQQFFNWLKERNLFEIYKMFWKAKQE